MAAGPDRNRDAYDEPPRSIFSTLWFRALVVILVLGIVAVIAVPYVLDMVNPSLSKPTASKPPAPATTGMPVAPAPTPPAAEPPPPTASASEPAGLAPRGSGTTSGMAVTPAPTGATPDAPAQPTTPAQPAPGRVAVAKPTPPTASRRPAAGGGTYWVQVGAFKDQSTAKRLVERLRAENFTVGDPVKSTRAGAAPSGDQPTDRYNVFVSGMAAEELTAKLTAKGLAADTVAGGVVVKPSLPLREAVNLSRELAGEGLRVQVRRAAAPAASASAGSTVYRVRVGSFPDRDAAQAALKELEAKGYKAFIARGGE